MNWTHEDVDNDGKWFVINGPIMSSFSWLNGVQLSPNNYTITPEINVTGASGLSLTYKVNGGFSGQSAEVYTVYVSTGNTVADFLNPAITVSFNEDLGNDPIAANGLVVSRTIDVSALDGSSSVYIAFRHHDANLLQWFISFDDVILETTLGLEDTVFSGFKIFMDSRNILQLSSSTKTLDGITIYNLLGQNILSNKLTSTKASIDLSALQSGIYIAQVSIDGTTNSFKILKK